MRIPSPGAVQSHTRILDLVHYLKGSAAPGKVMATSLSHSIRRPHEEDMTLVGVGSAAPGVTIALHSVEDSLKAQGAGRSRDFVIGIGLQYKQGSTSEEARVSTLGEHRGKQAIDKSST
jgi:hypothetical protein